MVFFVSDELPFLGEKFSKGFAGIDILVLRELGVEHPSLSMLADRWKWSRSNVDRFLHSKEFLAFCANNSVQIIGSGRRDVLLPEQTQSNKHKSYRLNKETYIYVIRDKNSNAVKVGRSCDPQKRLASLRVASSSDFVLVETFKGREEDEIRLHKILKEHGLHIQREWFRDNKTVLDIIYNYFNS